MEISKCSVLVIYSQGFVDELYGVFKDRYKKGSIESIAYNMGGSHAIVGDDVSSIDLMSGEEIYAEIIKRGS